jgi:hypothetical protein
VAARKPLRSVGADEVAQRKRPSTVSEAAESGTTRDLLVTMRARIARAVDDPNTLARDLAALTKRLGEVVRDIEAIDARLEQEGNDASTVEDGVFDSSAV